MCLLWDSQPGLGEQIGIVPGVCPGRGTAKPEGRDLPKVCSDIFLGELQLWYSNGSVLQVTRGARRIMSPKPLVSLAVGVIEKWG